MPPYDHTVGLCLGQRGRDREPQGLGHHGPGRQGVRGPLAAHRLGLGHHHLNVGTFQ